ncbi:MAG: alkaline phosphatase [Glaciihabitans sp.]|nr:alkaline phosphatase [Glaciihabitans sp.]MDQ1571277.1 rane-associated protein [Actinomycetota bacterium]
MFDLTNFLSASGPAALLIVAAFVFIETGLLFPFLPGDSLVFTAGLLASQLNLPLWSVILVAAVAAVIGDQTGYLIGRRLGRRLFKPNARVFKERYRDEADAFLRKYGPASLVLARFVPIVRTFVPPIVGTSTMRYRRFVAWNISGGVGWAVLLGLAGFWLGRIPFVANNIEYISIGIVIVSVLPIVIGVLRRRYASRELLKGRSRSPEAQEESG